MLGVYKPCFLSAIKKGWIKEMELKGSQTQIMKLPNRTRQSKAYTN